MLVSVQNFPVLSDSPSPFSEHQQGAGLFKRILYSSQHRLWGTPVRLISKLVALRGC